MIGAWLRANLATLAAAAALAGFLVQTVRIDGFPLFHTGMRTQLAECNAAQTRANEAAQAAADKAREEGRQGALADAARLTAEEAKRKADSDKTIADLQGIVARLQRPQPPVTVRVEGEPPVVVTAPVMGGSCAFDRGALDDLRRNLNTGRM